MCYEVTRGKDKYNGMEYIRVSLVNGVRVDRGGRWGLGSDYIRCSYRDRSSQGGSGDKVGFRLFCEWCSKGLVLWWCNGGEAEVC